MQTISIQIVGKVQGVFFRKYTVETARKYSLPGFVMNMPDGSVYIEATGEEDQLNEFVKWCHTGSPGSRVEQVTVKKLPYKKFEGFRIQYSS